MVQSRAAQTSKDPRIQQDTLRSSTQIFLFLFFKARADMCHKGDLVVMDSEIAAATVLNTSFSLLCCSRCPPSSAPEAQVHGSSSITDWQRKSPPPQQNSFTFPYVSRCQLIREVGINLNHKWHIIKSQSHFGVAAACRETHDSHFTEQGDPESIIPPPELGEVLSHHLWLRERLGLTHSQE